MTKRTFPKFNRRDFLGGVSLATAAGTFLSPMELMAKMGTMPEEYYPPSRTGMRGSHDGSWEVAHSISWEGKDWGRPNDQTDDTYDMIVVGGGISGLTAAFLYQQKSGGGKKILILDNHDDFGGHAKRTEFDVDGKLLIGYGGSQTIDSPSFFSSESKKVLKDLSIEVDKFYDYYDQDYFEKYEMSGKLLFEKSEYGEDHLANDPFALGNRKSEAEIINDVEGLPLSQEAKDSIRRLIFEAEDQFPDLSVDEKVEKLRSMSYTDYLQNYCGMPKEATDLLRDRTIGSWGAAGDALSALENVKMWMPGMRVYGDVYNAVAPDSDVEDDPYIHHFPDGNAGVARALVRKLIPEAVPGSTMEDLVLSKVDYSLLDRIGIANRIRLNSTAVNVQHTTDQSHVDVAYVNDNQTYRVRGKHVIMACYNNIVPYICPEVPDEQIEAISYATKIPLAFTNIALRNWRAFAEIKTDRISIPRSNMANSYALDFPVSMGGYNFSENPDQPIILQGYMVPMAPDQGFSHKEQAIMGRHKLYQLTYDDFEKSTLSHLEAMLKGTDFDPERDIAGITVNRWPHGYAWEYNDLYDDPSFSPYNGPHIAGRAQIGRISIANSDASAYAYVNGAIDAAVRAVDEQIAF